MGLFANELSILYEAFYNDRPLPLPKPAIQYSDYAIWQNEENNRELRERDELYWADVIKDAAFGQFPADYPRAFGKKGESATKNITIPSDLIEKIKSFSRKERATPFITFIAALQLVLHRYTGHENLLLGYYVSGRSQSEVKDLLGQYSSLAVIKTEFSGDPDFREIVKRTRRSIFDTYAHRHMPVSNISGYRGDEGSLNLTLFPVVFNFHNFPYPSWELCSLVIEPEPIASDTSRFDIEISIIPGKEEWTIPVQYRKDIYTENTIERILDHYRNILSSAIDKPDESIHKLSMMCPAEIRRIVEDWNSEKADYPADATIHQLIDEASKENPDAIALIYNGHEISYRQLINMSNYLARYLIEMGVEPEVMVGVYMERSHNLIITLLAVLKSGGVYVALDPIYPDEKLTYMLLNSNAPILLTEKEQTAKFPNYDGKIIEIESLLTQYSDATFYDLPLVNTNSENIAYLIYTSGSTGKPKGVQASHRNVVNSFCFMNIYIDAADTSRAWLFSTSVSFDPSVLEMFWTLSRGYRVIVLPNESSGKFLDIDAIPELMKKHHVSHFQCTPSVLRILMDRADGFAALKQLTKLMVGGERFPVDLAKRLSAETSIDVYNAYGPTETTLWATWHRLQKDDNPIPVGRPLPNYRVYILNKHLQPVPIGVYGELYIGGDGVARGYFNDSELTGRKYLPDPFSKRYGSRIYQTGDIARYGTDGTIEFLGRADRQVKIRGHRIELGEVEAAIMECGEVRETVVVASGNTDIDKKLLGYVIPDFMPDSVEKLSFYIKKLKETLFKKLPEFMIPASLMALDEFPKLSNGKIDRKSLLRTEIHLSADVGLKDALSQTESTILKAWEDVLGIDGFGIDDNYMDIGGNSLSAIIIINRIKSLLNIKITIKDFLDNPTIKQLAKLIERKIKYDAHEPPNVITPIERNDDMDDIPLSFFQESRLRHEFSRDIFNIPYLHATSLFNIRLSGYLDRISLENAMNYVINRHEVFRAAFWPVISGVSPGTNKWDAVCQSCRLNPGLLLPKVKFKQAVQPSVTVNLDYYNISEYGDKDKCIEVRIIADEMIEKRHRYESPPLTRAALIRITELEHILIVAASHLITDLVSMNIYEKELAYAYNALVKGQPVKLTDCELRYSDYVAWIKHRLETGSLDSMKSYWQNQFEGYTPTDVTILPFADIEGSENDADFSDDVKYYNHPVSDELSGAIRKYAGSVNMTAFSVAMAGFFLCLYCESGKTDIGIMTFFANRARPETENIIGMFAAGNIIRVKINTGDSLYQCAAAVSESLNGALKNQEYMIPPPELRKHKSLYDYVVSRPISCESWVDHECASFSGLKAERVILERGKSEHALKSYVLDYGKKLSLLFQYNLDLFDGADIKRMAVRTESIVKEIISNPLKIISSLSSLEEL